MSGAARSGISRGVALLAIVLLCAAFVAGVYAAPAPADVPMFATQQATSDGAVANFWGPALEPARQEPYAEAPNGSRRVQYFDKARMEETPSGVTNGLLTVELIHGQRQYGDTLFAAFPPCTLPVVGDPDNAWPTYQSLGASLLPEQANQSDGAIDTVYRQDGTFAHDAKLGAKPGAAAGSYVRDPGGRYAHNIPAAFWDYLTALPLPWLGVLGYPLTEPFWVNVRVNSVKRWVLVQPFERRVLSYTPDNAAAFTVEMGNIGQHYYRWRYTLAPDGADPLAVTPTGDSMGDSTSSGTAVSATTSPIASSASSPTTSAAASTTAPVISGVQFGIASSTTAALSFQTDVPATSRILFGLASHSYQTSQEISTTPTLDHRVTLSGLKPKTRYYFVLHADIDSGGSSESKEGYFATAPTDSTAVATQDASGNPAPDAQPTATARLSRIAKTATAADNPSNPALSADTLRPTETPRPTGTPRPTETATNTPRPATATPTSRPLTDTPTSRPPTDTPTPTKTPTPVPTPIPDVHVTVSGFAVGSDGSDLTIVQTNAATLAVTLADTASADTQQTTITPQAWVNDAANVRLVATDATTTLTMHGRGNAVTVRLDVSVPMRDHNTLAFSVTQTVYPSDYGAGKSYTVMKGVSAVPGYHVELHFTVSQ